MKDLRAIELKNDGHRMDLLFESSADQMNLKIVVPRCGGFEGDERKPSFSFIPSTDSYRSSLSVESNADMTIGEGILPSANRMIGLHPLFMHEPDIVPFESFVGPIDDT